MDESAQNDADTTGAVDREGPTDVRGGERHPEEPASIDDAVRREELNRYLADIHTIRELMTRYEEQPLIRHWVYVLWGILVIAGSTANWWFWNRGALNAEGALITIWLPILVIGGLFETLGWIQHAREVGSSLMTRRVSRLVALGAGVIVVFGVIIVHMVPSGLSTGVVLAMGAVPLLMYAHMTYASLFVEAFVLVSAAIVVEIVLPTTAVWLTASGVVVGLTYVTAGVHSRLAEQHRSATGPRE